MSGNPEDGHKLISASRLRLALSNAILRELQRRLSDTENTIRTTNAMIARSDRLIHSIGRVYAGAP
jgi:hypothetical protein